MKMKKEINNILFEASSKNDLKSIETSINEGASLKAKDNAGMTALTIAARDGHMEAVQFLIDKGSIISEDTLLVASMSATGSTDIVKLLQLAQMKQAKPKTRENNKEDSQLLKASHKGNLNKVNASLTDGADPNALDGLDTTPLRWAARGGFYNIVSLLLETGADVNQQSSTGWTALMESVIEGSIEVVELLIENGADVNARTYVDASSLYFATEQGYENIIDYLKDHNAEYSSPDFEDD